MPPTPDFYDRMAAAVERRYQVNAGKDLRSVYRLDGAFLDTTGDADFAFRNRREILSVLTDPKAFEQLVDLFIDRAIEFTYASNQFLQIQPEEAQALRSIYTGYVRQIERALAANGTHAGIAAALDATVSGHFRELRANLRRFFDLEAAGEDGANVVLQKVVCAEYAPQTQLDVLGLRPEALLTPVLDLGCGPQGQLVVYLRRARHSGHRHRPAG